MPLIVILVVWKLQQAAAELRVGKHNVYGNNIENEDLQTCKVARSYQSFIMINRMSSQSSDEKVTL